MKDTSRAHPKWRDACLNCTLPECAEDLPDEHPDKAKCPVYRAMSDHLPLVTGKRKRRRAGVRP